MILATVALFAATICAAPHVTALLRERYTTPDPAADEFIGIHYTDREQAR